MSATVLVIYYSGSGNAWKMAEAVAEGVRAAGRDATLKEAQAASVSDLQEAAALAVGSPTYFSNVAWPIKRLIDESIALYGEGGGYALRGRSCAIFTSSGTEEDARDCLRVLGLAFGKHHRMEMLPGVVRVDGQPEDEVVGRCRALGKALAAKV